jgi:hypothetical protein
MTKIAIVPNAAGTGTFTIEAPNSNSNRTLVLPDAAGELLTDVSDIETQVKAATNATGSAPVYACRAWVNFDGLSGSGNTIRGSGNVSSVARNGTGDYTVNFTTAMPDVNYSAALAANMNSALTPATATERVTDRALSSYRFYTAAATTTLLNSTITSASFFR